LNEKIKRKAHVKQSFSLDFLERGTFTEYPEVEKIVTVYACDSDAIVVIYRHYPYWIASLFYKGNSPTTFLN